MTLTDFGDHLTFFSCAASLLTFLDPIEMSQQLLNLGDHGTFHLGPLAGQNVSLSII